jgi:hypothetical protein
LRGSRPARSTCRCRSRPVCRPSQRWNVNAKSGPHPFPLPEPMGDVFLAPQAPAKPYGLAARLGRPKAEFGSPLSTTGTLGHVFPILGFKISGLKPKGICSATQGGVLRAKTRLSEKKLATAACALKPPLLPSSRQRCSHCDAVGTS